MITSRRGFFGLLGGAAAAAIVAPELEIITRKIFLPPRGGWPSHAFTSSELTMSLHDFAERYLRPALAEVANIVDRDARRIYDPAFAQGNRTATINIRRPQAYAMAIGEQTTERLDDRFRITIPYTIEGVHA